MTSRSPQAAPEEIPKNFLSTVNRSIPRALSLVLPLALILEIAMATLATGAITSSNTGYFAQKYSPKLYFESVVKNPINKILMENGCVNREDALSNDSGGTVYMYNALRLNGKGFTGDIDVYTNAQLLEKTTRSLNIFKNQLPISWPMRGTQTQQYASFDIGSANEEALNEWVSSLLAASYMNQLAGNTATSITQLSCSETAFTGSELTRITGNNSASVPTYHYWGSSPGTAKTTDASIGSGDVLTIKDFQFATEIITSQQPGKPTWQIFKNKPYIAIAFISMSGLNQLSNEAVTPGQGYQLSQIYNAMLAGGEKLDLQQFMLPGVPFLFAVVPDSFMPRGVTLSTGAETANSRRCVIVGRNAADVSFGRGFSPEGGKIIPGASVEVDMEFKKLNKQGYAVANLLWGCKKAASTGPGSGASTEYDLSTYVITHYSRT